MNALAGEKSFQNGAWRSTRRSLSPNQKKGEKSGELWQQFDEWPEPWKKEKVSNE